MKNKTIWTSFVKNKNNTHTLKVNPRTVTLLQQLQKRWFPDQEENKNMSTEDFIYILACSLICNNVYLRKKK